MSTPPRLAAWTSALFTCEFAGFEIVMVSVCPFFNNEDIQHMVSLGFTQ
jgi:hypothetical protein